MTSQRPILVCGLPRSGTTFCERAIAAAEGILGAGEPFHESEALRSAWAPALPVWDDGPPADWLLRACAAAAPRRLALKVFDGQFPDEELRRLCALAAVVRTVRDPVERLVSLRQAIQSDDWNRLLDGRDMFGGPAVDRLPAGPVRLSADEIDEALRLDRDEAARWRWLPPPACVIRYTEICADPAGVCRRLVASLGLRGVAPQTVRLHPEPLSERVRGE